MSYAISGTTWHPSKILTNTATKAGRARHRQNSLYKAPWPQGEDLAFKQNIYNPYKALQISA